MGNRKGHTFTVCPLAAKFCAFLLKHRSEPLAISNVPLHSEAKRIGLHVLWSRLLRRTSAPRLLELIGTDFSSSREDTWRKPTPMWCSCDFDSTQDGLPQE